MTVVTMRSPASSRPQATRCAVRGEAATSQLAPGFEASSAAPAQRRVHSWNAAGVVGAPSVGLNVSHPRPMNPMPYGGSVMMASMLAGSSVRRTRMALPVVIFHSGGRRSRGSGAGKGSPPAACRVFGGIVH